ncbi:tetra-peptide repeat homeobox protein 1-like [Euwallacea similis]|uniref:tetra-peptide repeat homeobox protein 1-like n=1 Tax=Euwallacea similis TaxID=1736056 RepID=UPI00344EC642
MASRFAIALVGLIAVISQASAGPACGTCGLPFAALSALRGYGGASALSGFGSGCGAPSPSPRFVVPSSITYNEPNPTVNQKHDIHIPLPLPSRIPLGNYCTCQKYAVKPTLIPCVKNGAPAPFVAPAPAPGPSTIVFGPPQVSAPAPATCVSAPAGTTTTYVSAPAPSPVTYVSAPAPASVTYVSAPVPAAGTASVVNAIGCNPLENLENLLNSLPAPPAPVSVPAPACA